MNLNSVGWNLPPDSANGNGNGVPQPAHPAYPTLPSQNPTFPPYPVGVAAGGAAAPTDASSVQWLPGSDGSIPPSALIGGKDIDGEPLYIGRARFGGGLLPGKLKPRHRGCYVGFAGKEHLVKHYEVLCNMAHEWKEARKDEIPEGALEAGYSETGEKLYIGRIKHKDSLCLGKVQPSHKCLYIVFAGKEVAYKAYQIFISK